MILWFSSFADEKTEGPEGLYRFPELMSLGIGPQDRVTSELPLSRQGAGGRGWAGLPTTGSHQESSLGRGLLASRGAQTGPRSLPHIGHRHGTRSRASV